MSQFSQCLEIKSVKAAYIKRNASVIELNSAVSKFKKLDVNNPNPRQYAYINKEFEAAEQTLKADNHTFVQHILHASQDFSSDTDFAKDQESIKATQFAAMNNKDIYQAKLEELGHLPKLTDQLSSASMATPTTDLALLLTKMNEAQVKRDKEQSLRQDKLLTELSKNQVAATAAVSGPKPVQPSFHPKGEKSDYLLYKSFIKKFEYFTTNVASNVDKLNWLFFCVKGDAFEVIKTLTLEDANYKIALDRLNKIYLDDKKIIQSIVSTIYKYHNPSPDKNYSNIAKGLTSLENHIAELKSVHKYDCYEGAANLIVSHIIFHNLPGKIKTELIDMSDSFYPDLAKIFELVPKVIDKVNIIAGHEPSYPKENLKKSKTSTETQSDPDSDKPFIGVNSIGNDNPASKSTSNKHKNKNHTRYYKGNYKSFVKFPCKFCGSMDHPAKFCPKFHTKEARWKSLQDKSKDHKLCTTCTRWMHPGDPCDQKYLCRCNKGNKHHSILCPEALEISLLASQNSINKAKTNESDEIACKFTAFEPAIPDHDTGVYSMTANVQRAVALQTAVLSAENVEASEVPLHDKNVAILADTAAQKSLVTKELADRLKLPIVKQERASILGFGQNKADSKIYKVIELTLCSPDGCANQKTLKINAYVVNNLNPIHMTGICKFASRLQSKGINLADRRLVNSKKDTVNIDLLLGADYYDLLVSPFHRPKQVCGMWLSRTIFGHYMLKGRIPGSSEAVKHDVNANCITIQHIASHPIVPILNDYEQVDTNNVFDIVREMNNYDALGIRMENRDDEDKEAEMTFKSNMTIDENTGKYIVGFPWLNNIPPDQNDLDSNYDIVKARFLSTCKNLDKNPDKLNKYRQVHEQELKNEFIEIVPEQELSDDTIPKHFINHFPIWKEKPGVTTTCRRVFDASLHKKGKASLNDMMLKGSQLTPHILSTNLRLRLKEFLMSADVSKAFMRMELRPQDRNYTCFFARKNWEDPKSPVLVYRFKSVIFGATSSPFMLNCTVADILEQNKFNKKLEIFVDNLFLLLDSNLDILPAADKILDIFKAAAMPLHEFASNCPEANRVFKDRGIMTESDKLKTLGLQWDYINDTWFINEPIFHTENITKRSVLSDIARLYDPVGFLAPLSVQGRLIVQEAWEYDLKWDARLPDEDSQKWSNLVSQLKSALQIPIPRWVGFSNLGLVSIHGFTDASEKALGVVIYLVGPNHSIMYTAKAKICPIKMSHFTTPRKELTALSLGARYLPFVIKAIIKYFTPVSVHLWSDSTTALAWCLSKKPHKQLYIRSRVDDIDMKIQKYNIAVHYIKNSNNPADMLTKDTGKSLQDPLWIHGPGILLNPRDWKPHKPESKLIDSIPIFCGHVPAMTYANLPDPKSYMPDKTKQDKLLDLHKDTAKLFFKTGKINLAQNKWIKTVQSNHYPDVFKFLEQLKGYKTKSIEGKKIRKSIEKEQGLATPTICLNLHLFLDDHNIIRVKTSHANCTNLSNNQRFPILMPAKDPYTHLIIIHSHVESGHMGLNYTRSHLRSKFWVPKESVVINNIVKKCQICSIQRGQRYHVPDSPALPAYRFNVEEPWGTTAIDMTGHMLTREHGSEDINKVYFIVFVCMSTGAGHIEMTPDASSDSFSNAFKRFTARRGVPKRLISDQGSNFKGFNKELKSIADNSITLNYLSDTGIEWKWTPIGDPHFNGFVERHLGILKSIMKKSIGNKILSKDSLATIACYAESLFNERPLCIMDADDPDFLPITPNMLNYGRSLRHFNHDAECIDLNDPDFLLTHKSINLKLKRLKSYLAQVRKIWIRDYLQLLTKKDIERQKRSPFTKSLIQPKVNDWVLIKDNNNDIRIGRILQLVTSEDGEIRSAILKTKSGSEGCYPITNLRYLEYHNEGSKDLDATVTNDQIKQRTIRPQRKAALEAQTKFLINCLFSCSNKV